MVDDAKEKSLKENSLRTAGYALLVGDAGLFASGMMSRRYKEAMAGAAWGIGGLVCAKYGNANADMQLKLLSHKLGGYLRKEGVAIPTAPDTAELTREGGLVDRTEAFLYTYPSQVLNGVFTVGGVQLLRSGLQHGKGWDAASGALVTAGALGGLLLPEKTPDPNAPPPSNPLQWIQEKPLRVPAIAYTLNDGTLFMSALKERRTNPAQKSYQFKFLTVASYLFGNAMLSMSSKGHGGAGGAPSEAMEKLADVSARVIAAQPEPLREALTQHISGYLAGQPEVKRSADYINAMLHERLAAQHVNMPHVIAHSHSEYQPPAR